MRTGAVLVAMTGLLLLGGAVRLAQIERTQGEALRRRADRQQTVRRVTPALRGEIWDTRGRVLASTVRRPSVFADPELVQDVRFAAYSVAPVLGVDAAEVERLLDEPTQPRFVWLRRQIGAEDRAALERILRERRLRGIGLQDEPARAYPQGRLAAHVLGFVGVDLREAPAPFGSYEDLRGLAGVEAAYDELLSGRLGYRTAKVDGARRRVRSETDGYVPAVDGATVVLTIDAVVQQMTEEALRAAVAENKAEWGVAVVMDPQSGEVLAMAVAPDFDPAEPFPPGLAQMSDAKREAVKLRWRNRAVSDAYEPGSIFKPFVASGALDEGVIRIDEVFQINGPARSFGRRTLHDTHAYGALAVHEIISKSSNIGMGLVGARCGMERLYRYVCSFGFGQPTGVGLPGEHDGLVLDFAKWNPSFSPQSVPIGQEIAVTPIQIVTAFSVFCNGGRLLKPRIVRGVIGPDGQTLVDDTEPVVVRRVLGERTAETFRLRALVETVRSGTGKRADIPLFQVFGKTGTAQVARAGGGGYVDGAFTASFVGGAPSDRPRLVVLVSLFRPAGSSHYGGVIAAPVAGKIIAQALDYMQVPPELPQER